MWPSSWRNKCGVVGFLQIPYLCIPSLIFCSICFTLGGVVTDSATTFFEFWIISYEYAASVTFFNVFLAVLTPIAQVATIIIPVVVNFWYESMGTLFLCNCIFMVASVIALKYMKYDRR